MKVSGFDWLLLSPELFLTAAGLLVLAISAFFDKAKEEFLAFLSILAAAATIGIVAFISGVHGREAPILAGMFVVDNFAIDGTEMPSAPSPILLRRSGRKSGARTARKIGAV